MSPDIFNKYPGDFTPRATLTTRTLCAKKPTATDHLKAEFKRRAAAKERMEKMHRDQLKKAVQTRKTAWKLERVKCLSELSDSRPALSSYSVGPPQSEREVKNFKVPMKGEMQEWSASWGRNNEKDNMDVDGGWV
jgi:hypothetical protein